MWVKLNVIYKAIYLIGFVFIIEFSFLSQCAAEQSSSTRVQAEIAEDNLVQLNPEIVNLGHEKYRLGSIKVDKTQRSFVVGGRLLRKQLPIEFLAVTQGGIKHMKVYWNCKLMRTYLILPVF